MSTAKTGALLGCAASIGAILAGAPDATVGALRDYGRHLGLAFQAIDDLLGIWGDPATHRQAGRQRPAPAQEVHAGGVRPGRRRSGGRRAAGPRSLGSPGVPATRLPRSSRDEIERATYLVEACGGREWTAVRAKANLDAALGALERVRLSAIPHRDLADIAVYVVERES